MDSVLPFMWTDKNALIASIKISRKDDRKRNRTKSHVVSVQLQECEGRLIISKVSDKI